jgi:hypothetical protein
LYDSQNVAVCQCYRAVSTILGFAAPYLSQQKGSVDADSKQQWRAYGRLGGRCAQRTALNADGTLHADRPRSEHALSIQPRRITQAPRAFRTTSTLRAHARRAPAARRDAHREQHRCGRERDAAARARQRRCDRRAGSGAAGAVECGEGKGKRRLVLGVSWAADLLSGINKGVGARQEGMCTVEQSA